MSKDANMREKLNQFQREANLSWAAIARMIGVSASAVNLWRADKYAGSNEVIERKIAQFLDLQRRRAESPAEPAFVMTTAAKMIFETLDIAQVMGRMVVITGRAGYGKTKAVRQYVENHENVIFITYNPTVNTHKLMMEIGKKIGVSIRNDAYSIFKRIVAQIKNTPRMIIIDEAQQMSYRPLETIRAIHDETGVGVALIGANSLIDNLTSRIKETDQLWSRVRIKRQLKPLTASDAKMILQQHIVDIEDSLVKYMLESSSGNARQMTNALMVAMTMARANGGKIDRAVIEKANKYLMVA